MAPEADTLRADSDAPDWLARHLTVVLWGFPEPSQTFIQREMEHIVRLGGEVNVLAGHRVPRTDLSPALAQITEQALYIGRAARWVPRGLAYAARHPKLFADVLRWGVRLPHRSPWHRVRMAGMLLAAASVADEVKAGGYTLLLAHFAAYHTEMVMCLSRLTGIPYGFVAHATGIWKDRNLLREKIEGAEVVLTCTRHNVEHLLQIAPTHADKIHLVYHGLDFSRLPEPTPLPKTGPTRFLAVGRLVPKKGFRYLIEAIAHLRDRNIDVELTILGDGPEANALAAQASNLGLEDCVMLRGAVPNDDVWTALQQSHALVAPSIRARDGNLDGIPNVALEAMAMARPVVGSRLSGIPEIVQPGETGLLVEPENSRALADALAEIAADRAKAARMGQNARSLVREAFDVQTNMQRQLDILQSATQPEATPDG